MLSTRLSAWSRKRKVALGLASAIVVVAVLFDWNWFRPAVERYLSRHSGREVRADDMHLGLDETFHPRLRFRGIYIQNTSWASSPKPMARAGEVSFTFNWQGLMSRKPVAAVIELVDADIALERRADGIRNWRLSRPDDAGPPRMIVLRLKSTRSQLQFIHGGLGLEFQAVSTPLEPPQGALVQQVTFTGRYKGVPFSGESAAGPVLSLRDTREYFPLRGRAESQGSRLEFEGQLADLIRLERVDARVKLAGPSLGAASVFVTLPLAKTPAYRAQLHLVKDGEAVSAREIVSTFGQSDFAGRIDYDAAKDGRWSVDADLRSRGVAWADVESAINAGSGSAPARPRQNMLEGLDNINAKLKWKVGSFVPPAGPGVKNAAIELQLQGAVLDISKLSADVAQGRISGQMKIDGQAKPARVTAKLRADELRIESLVPEQASRAQAGGRVKLRASLQAVGESLSAWRASAEGSVELALTDAHIGNRFDAKLGLNGGKLVRSYLSGPKPVALNCALADVRFRRGVGESKALLIDTERTRVEGRGTLDLNTSAWHVLLTPHAYGRAPFALSSSILVEGSFTEMSRKLVARDETVMGKADCTRVLP